MMKVADSEKAIELLSAAGVKLVGMDAIK